MKVFPVAGRHLLRDPLTKRVIPKDGIEVPENHFWMQCLAQGDVTLAAPDSETAHEGGDHA